MTYEMSSTAKARGPATAFDCGAHIDPMRCGGSRYPRSASVPSRAQERRRPRASIRSARRRRRTPPPRRSRAPRLIKCVRRAPAPHMRRRSKPHVATDPKTTATRGSGSHRENCARGDKVHRHEHRADGEEHSTAAATRCMRMHPHLHEECERVGAEQCIFRPRRRPGRSSRRRSAPRRPSESAGEQEQVGLLFREPAPVDGSRGGGGANTALSDAVAHAPAQGFGRRRWHRRRRKRFFGRTAPRSSEGAARNASQQQALAAATTFLTGGRRSSLITKATCAASTSRKQHAGSRMTGTRPRQHRPQTRNRCSTASPASSAPLAPSAVSAPSSKVASADVPAGDGVLSSDHERVEGPRAERRYPSGRPTSPPGSR